LRHASHDCVGPTTDTVQGQGRMSVAADVSRLATVTRVSHFTERDPRRRMNLRVARELTQVGKEECDAGHASCATMHHSPVRTAQGSTLRQTLPPQMLVRPLDVGHAGEVPLQMHHRPLQLHWPRQQQQQHHCRCCRHSQHCASGTPRLCISQLGCRA
jgi:hypothetical protein